MPWIIGVVLVLAILIGLISQTHSGTSPSNTTIATCDTTDLSLTTGNRRTTVGTTYLDAILSNTSEHTCVIDGYPQVNLVDGSGNPVASRAMNNGTVAPKPLTIAPGQTVHSTITLPDPGGSLSETCSATAKRLSVVPPNETVALTIPLAEKACTGFAAMALQAGN
jgi:FlaG/FlaF family flagellin (archaellin)